MSGREPPKRRIEVDLPDAPGMTGRTRMMQTEPLTDDEACDMLRRLLAQAHESKARGVVFVVETDPNAEPRIAFYTVGSPRTQLGTTMCAITELLSCVHERNGLERGAGDVAELLHRSFAVTVSFLERERPGDAP